MTMWLIKTVSARCLHCGRKFKYRSPTSKVTCPHCRWAWLIYGVTTTYVKPFSTVIVQVERGLLFVGKEVACR